MKSNLFTLDINLPGWAILHNGKPICKPVMENGKINAVIENGKARDIRLNQDIEGITYSGDGFTITDIISELENGFYKIQRIFKNTTEKERQVVLMFECEAMYKPDFYMIPSVTYNGNKWGQGKEPKGLSHEGKPWVFGYQRASIPSATFSENNDVSIGLFACDKNAESLVSACSMSETDSGITHRLIWPDREEPLVYISRDEYAPAHTPEITINGGAEYAVIFYLSLNPVTKPFYGWTNTYDRAQKLMNREITGHMSSEDFWKLRVNFIKDTQYTKIDRKYSLLEIGYLPDGHIYNFFPEEHGTQGIEFKRRDTGDRRFEIGWTGQNASAAVALIYDYIKTGNEDSLRIGTEVLDTWATHAPLPCGLFEVEFDELLGTHPKNYFNIDTCNLGWGIWQMLEAYQALKTVNIDKPTYKTMALNACDFFLTNKTPGGSFGKTWNRDGTPGDINGTIGCFLLLGLIKAHEITGKAEYLNCTKEMFRYYVDRDLARMECTAGALDTYCIDKETCWPLLKVGLDLYELTGEKEYLDDATLAAYYMLSFTFVYDALYGPETDFATLGYRTYGGTSVSTQHHHLDPWGSLMAYDYYRLYKLTGDEKWHNWYEALWKNAMLCVSDGNLIVHGLRRPPSTQNEIFLQNRFTFSSDCPPGRLNDWLQSWPGQFKLVTLYRAMKDGVVVG